MTTPRKLEEIASSLDDLSITLDEIKNEMTDGASPNQHKLDRVKADMERAADAIEESVDPPAPAST